VKLARALFLVLGLAAASCATAQPPQGEYLEGRQAKVGVVLAHGRGGSPDGNVVGPLRRAIHGELGFYTLSLRMPDVGDDRLDNPALVAAFPEAYQRIQTAIEFLQKEKGVERVYLMGHSMGGRMTSGFLADHPAAGVAGFIGVGLVAGGKEPVNTNLNLRRVKVPVLDVYGDNALDAKSAANRHAMVSERFVQIEIPGAQHDYRGYEKQVADAVIGWLRKQEGK